MEFKVQELRNLFNGKAEDVVELDVKNAEWEYFYPDSHYAGRKKSLAKS